MSLQEPNIPDKGLTPFVLAMPEEFKDNDPVLAYRNYYAGAKFKFATWKNRKIPKWYIKLRHELGENALIEVAELLDPVNIKQKRQASKEKKMAKLLKKEEREKKRNASMKNIKKELKKLTTEAEIDEKNKNKEKTIEKIKLNSLMTISGVKTRNMCFLEEKLTLHEELQKRSPDLNHPSSPLIKKFRKI